MIEEEEGTDLRNLGKVGFVELSNCLEEEVGGKKKVKIELEIFLNPGNWENANAKNRKETVKQKGWVRMKSMVWL